MKNFRRLLAGCGVAFALFALAAPAIACDDTADYPCNSAGTTSESQLRVLLAMPKPQSAVIDQATNSITSEIDLNGRKLVRVIIPSSWTAANLTFQAASASGGTYNNVTVGSDGSEYVVTAAASSDIIVPLADFIGHRFIKIRSGTSGVPVSQAAPRTLTLIVIP